MLHLVAGNLAIGWLEGRLLARLYRQPPGRATLFLVIANYVSAWLGAALILGVFRPLVEEWIEPDPFALLPRLLVLMLALSFALTVLVEWPFCVAVLRKAKTGWGEALRASLLLQSVSYALLIPFYLLVGPISALTSYRVVRPSAIAAPPNASIYFIATDGSVCRMRPDGWRRERLALPRLAHPDARLLARRGADGRGWELWAVNHPREKAVTRLLRGQIGRAGLTNREWQRDTILVEAERLRRNGDHDLAAMSLEHGRAMAFGLAARFEAAEPAWRVVAEFWPGQGLTAWNTRTDERRGIALETPFVAWIARAATLLPGEAVVFQFGSRIVLLDLHTQRLADLGAGVTPVVALE
jgi:hypothetical protein